MGTTRIKVIDLSSDQQEIKTSRKHAEKLAGVAKIKKPEKSVARETEPENQLVKEEGLTQKTQPVEKSEDQQTEIAETSANKPPTTGEPQAAKVTTPRTTTHHAGKKYQNAKKLVENRLYSVSEAIALLPKTSITSFDPSVEVHFNVVDKNIKGSTTLPHEVKSKKKEIKYLIFSSKQSTLNQKSIIWGDEKTIDDIQTGKLKPNRDFNLVISTPEFMPSLAKIAKILGPAGLMPNPKNGTITEDVQKTIKSQDAEGYKFKTDPNAPVVHAKIGKLSQKSEELSDNLKTLILAIGPSKIKKAVIVTTMGPAVKLDIASI